MKNISHYRLRIYVHIVNQKQSFYSQKCWIFFCADLDYTENVCESRSESRKRE